MSNNCLTIDVLKGDENTLKKSSPNYCINLKLKYCIVLKNRVVGGLLKACWRLEKMWINI